MPAGGWAGTLHEQATLTATGAERLQTSPDVSISGATVVAAGFQGSGSNDRVAEVFTMPTAGWSGSIHQAATLVPLSGALWSDRVVIVGDTVFSAGQVAGPSPATTSRIFVFNEPARGWLGVIHDDADLILGKAASVESLEASSTTVALSTGGCATTSGPCSGYAWAFTEPPRGWVGTCFAKPALSVSAPILSALSGNTLFVTYATLPPFSTAGTETQIALYTATGAGQVPAPTASHLSLTGLATRNPRFAVTLSTRSSAPAISSIGITLPAGLRPSSARRLESGGLRLSGASVHTINIHAGQLTITLRKPTRHLSVALNSRGLTESKQLAKQAASTTKHPKHNEKAVTLKGVTSATDTAGDNVPVPIAVTLT